MEVITSKEFDELAQELPKIINFDLPMYVDAVEELHPKHFSQMKAVVTGEYPHRMIVKYISGGAAAVSYSERLL